MKVFRIDNKIIKDPYRELSLEFTDFGPGYSFIVGEPAEPFDREYINLNKAERFFNCYDFSLEDLKWFDAPVKHLEELNEEYLDFIVYRRNTVRDDYNEVVIAIKPTIPLYKEIIFLENDLASKSIIIENMAEYPYLKQLFIPTRRYLKLLSYY